MTSVSSIDSLSLLRTDLPICVSDCSRICGAIATAVLGNDGVKEANLLVIDFASSAAGV